MLGSILGRKRGKEIIKRMRSLEKRHVLRLWKRKKEKFQRDCKVKKKKKALFAYLINAQEQDKIYLLK